ncbi:MAG TPA: sugar kinase, partial [Anseongella sp.]|nr:sugar kinase [Anseongella sp.]
MSKAVGDLIAEGLVIEQGYAPSSGGRRPLIYSLRPDGMFVLSVAMDQLATQMVIVDMRNQPVSASETFELELQGNPKALSALTERIKAFLNRSGVAREKIIGAGIGMPG